MLRVMQIHTAYETDITFALICLNINFIGKYFEHKM